MNRKSFLQFGRKALAIVIALMIIVQSLPLGLLPGQRLPKAAEAASINKTSQSDWQAGKFENNQIKVSCLYGSG
jgi:hypothetical protein